MSTKAQHFLIALLFLPSALFSSQTGKVIILYGAHCGGKSTLAQELAQTLPESFEIISKQEIVDHKRKEYIEKVTGKRPGTREEILTIADTLPPERKRKALGFSKDSIRDTLLLIKKRALQGKNSIYPVCLYDPSSLSVLEDVPHVFVLVHAPLTTLSRRDMERSSRLQFSQALQQKRRIHTLQSFAMLYKPVSENDPECMDTLLYDEISQYATDTKKNGKNPLLNPLQKHIADHFALSVNGKTGLAPKARPELFVHSEKTNVKVAAAIVKRKLYANRNQAS